VTEKMATTSTEIRAIEVTTMMRAKPRRSFLRREKSDSFIEWDEG
jgi:hypothetical protein